MLHIKELNGNTIKKLTEAKTVRKTFDNKQKTGAGSFGYVILFTPHEMYTIRGFYGPDGIVYNLKASTYGSRLFTAQEDLRLKIINEALYKISIGKEEKPKDIPRSEKIPVKKVIIHWIEGKVKEKYPMEFSSLEAANKKVLQNAYADGPKGGSYNKHKITVYWKDGKEYQTRLDVKYPSEPNADTNIGQNIKWDFDYVIKAIDSSPESRRQAKEFIEKYDLGL